MLGHGVGRQGQNRRAPRTALTPAHAADGGQAIHHRHLQVHQHQVEGGGLITLNSQSQAALSAFKEAARRVPEIMDCYLMTGEADYLIRVVARDVDAFETLHAGAVTRLLGVSRIPPAWRSPRTP